MRRLFTVFLALLLSITSIPLGTGLISINAEGVSLVEEYELYPKPQNFAYESGDFIIDNKVNVVIEEGIDEYTVARLEEVLSLKGIKPSYSNQMVEGTTNILVGINGSKGFVDSYYHNNYSIDHSDLWDHNDANTVRIDSKVITVLGAHTDAAFYGLTTLYHIVTQMDSLTIRNLMIEDYADVISRGFIEGYYGEPWSQEDRVDLMTFGGYYKLNSYFYAPKDDPKHNSDWKTLYNEEELENMRTLAEAGNKSKNRFVYALHPYMHNAIRYDSDENYEADMKILKDKFQQMLDVGVRQFSILGDDAGVPGGKAENYVRTLEDMTEWLISKQKDYPGLKTVLPFVPNDYMGNGSSEQLQTLKTLPKDIQIVMTGGRVWGEVSSKFTDTFESNMDRGAYMWINWPCTDNSKKHLIMGGGETFLQPNVDPATIEGIVLNPMQQSEPSKLAIFINAAYAWNIWDSYQEADEAWENAFSYIDHNTALDTESSIAYRELSKHMINQDMDGRVTALQESVDLKPILNDFKVKYEESNLTTADIDVVLNEFKILQEAAVTYRNNPGNPRTRDQIIPWLNSWDDTTLAAISYLEAIRAQLNNDEGSLVNYFSRGQAAFARSKTHGFKYLDSTQYAEVGVQHIVPFILSLESKLTSTVEDISGIGPDQRFITNIVGKPQIYGGLNLDVVLDGDKSSFAYWQGYVINKDTFIGLDFGTKLKLVTDFEVNMGHANSSYDHDTMYGGVVQYTLDNENWITIDELTFNARVNQIKHQFDEPIEMRALRVVSTVDVTDRWFGLKDIVVNTIDSDDDSENNFPYSLIKTDEYSFYSGDESSLFDGDISTFAWFQPNGTPPNKDAALPGEFVGFDIGSIQQIQKINLSIGGGTGDKYKQYAIETSLDNENWVLLDGYENYKGVDSGRDNLEIDLGKTGLELRYVRVRNLVQVNAWIRFSDFSVEKVLVNSTKNIYTNVDSPNIFSTDHDGVFTLTPGQVMLSPNEYYGLDLKSISNIANFNRDVESDGLTLESSINGVQWTEGQIETARYIRYINKTDNEIPFTVNDLSVEIEQIILPYLHSSDVPVHPGYASSDMRNAHNSNLLFDGKLSTGSQISGFQNEGTSIVFDLGQIRDINSLRYYVVETQKDYIRSAKFELSDTLDGNYTEVFTIGDGLFENTADNTTAKDADYLTHDSRNPGYMYGGSDQLETQGRFLKITFTKTYSHRFSYFSEIMINHGEYTPVEVFPAVQSSAVERPYEVASNMFDKNMSTVFTPNSDKGKFTFYHSDPKDVKRVRILQNGVSTGASATAYLMGGKARRLEVIEIGDLNNSITEFNIPEGKILHSIEVRWTEGPISLSEIIDFNTSRVADFSNLKALINTSVDTSNWIQPSIDNYKSALENAKNIANNSNLSQAMVDSAYALLKQSIDNGIDKYNRTNLSELVENKIENDLNFYTVISYNRYLVSFNIAFQALSDVESLSQDQGLVLENDLLNTINSLQFSNRQRENAEIKVDEMMRQSLNSSDFTKDSFDALSAIIQKINTLIADDKDPNTPRLHPTVFMNELKILESQELVVVRALNAELTRYEGVNKNSFTDSSYNAYQELADQSYALLINGSQSDIDKAVTDLAYLYSQLILKEDVSLLDLLSEIDSLNEANYAPKTFKNLMKAVESINLDDPTLEKEQVVLLLSLIDNLVNIVELNSQIENAGKMDLSIYTSSSVQTYLTQLDKVKSSIEMIENNQDLLDVQDDLVVVLKGLVKKIDGKTYQNYVDSIEDVDSLKYTKESYDVYLNALENLLNANLDDLSVADFYNLIDLFEEALSSLEENLVTVEPKPDKEPNKEDKLPNTGVSSNTVVYILGGVAIIIGIIFTVIKKRSTE